MWKRFRAWLTKTPLYKCKWCKALSTKHEMIIDLDLLTAYRCPKCDSFMASDVSTLANWDKTPSDYHLFKHNQRNFSKLICERREMR